MISAPGSIEEGSKVFVDSTFDEEDGNMLQCNDWNQLSYGCS